MNEETDCYRTHLARTISENIPAMEQFVDNIWTTEGESVYSKAFHKAFQYFVNSPSTNGYRGSCYDILEQYAYHEIKDSSVFLDLVYNDKTGSMRKDLFLLRS